MITTIAVLFATAFIFAVTWIAKFVKQRKIAISRGDSHLPILGGVLVAIFGFLLTAQMCGPSFLLYLVEDGRCAATDTPAEVLEGTTLLAAVVLTPIVTIFALWRIFKRAS
jgi:hypothetical protein